MTLTSAIWTTSPYTIAEEKTSDTVCNSKTAEAEAQVPVDKPRTTGPESSDNALGIILGSDEVLAGSQENTHQGFIGGAAMVDEKTPLLQAQSKNGSGPPNSLDQVPLLKRIAIAITAVFTAIVSTLAAPGIYVLRCFYNEQGRFSLIMPLNYLGWMFGKRRKSAAPPAKGLASLDQDDGEKTEDDEEAEKAPLQRRSSRYNRSLSANTGATRPPLPVGGDRLRRISVDTDSPSQHTRSRSSLEEVAENSEPSTPTRTTRIKIAQHDALRQRRQRPGPQGLGDSNPREPSLTVDSIKSPTSPAAASRLTKYPHNPNPPRPLIPRRQPSYTTATASSNTPLKTLILDLDETLIHSMAKGGRMSTGHMVEVKLDTPVGAGGGVIAPQVPILYYVHKRPHCDDFLRKVSKWYNLVVFTASVQEYADPVIEWLELERKYFSARYYRQHCTYRSGAYIKDVSTVEPDLSKVMILDNSPLSYIFHEDNAIPIEGWISDPTDNDLLHLIPLLEGLQYATDVRSLLSLRLGESTAM